MSQSEELLKHFWLPTGQSLCYRRTLAQSRKMPEAAMCGVCVLAATAVREWLLTLLDSKAQRISPDEAGALEMLATTPWAKEVDLAQARSDIESGAWRYRPSERTSNT